VPDYQRIYRQEAGAYDRLVAAEDAGGGLAAALAARLPLRGARLLDVGTGTGRVLRLLARAGARVVGVDQAAAMLRVAQGHIRAEELDATLALADAAALPVAGGWADGAVAGWVFGHLRTWRADRWRDAIGRCLDEMRRACRPGATCVVIETLGTGADAPGPPTPELADYYAWLEGERGFVRATLRTDYRFGSVDEAVQVIGGFFGPELAARVAARGWATVPEHTGVWSLGAPG
jgi:ubiquinone/menaquinone biosynthesis C-methylase UbiE